MKKYLTPYDSIITLKNMLNAWSVFLRGKRHKKDVLIFQLKLMDNIYGLREDLILKNYIHGTYQSFNIADPKPRSIHKATVRDRLVHHLIYQELAGFFDTIFIHDSYSCRIGKGMHRALYRFETLARSVSKNTTRTCWVLKCDVRKFFASIDHYILKKILTRYIEDSDMRQLLDAVIDSFHTDGKPGVGLPLGNLTSQLLVNVYMNEFDQVMKREFKVKNYIRYADDFVILSDSRRYLEELVPNVSTALKRLKLSLHDKKLFIKTHSSGVDFLGWVHFPNYRRLRTSTKRRMLKNVLRADIKEGSIASYLGMLKHGNGYDLSQKIRNSSDHVSSPRN